MFFVRRMQKGNAMPIQTDCHLHSAFSGDSDTPMEQMILRGISLGLQSMCFTEHNDFDYPSEAPSSKEEQAPAENEFLLNTDSYLYDFLCYREKYAPQIKLLFGVELGLQPHLIRENSQYARSYDFDFIIGSSHVCGGRDPYYPSFFTGRSEEEAYREYFASILENIQKFSDFDVYGHLDYIVRYGPDKDRYYSYGRYRDLFDRILTLLIENGKGIEINTGGLSEGLREPHPCTDIVRRYHELGGEIVTIGSDAHSPSRIAAHFDRAAEVLEACGFRYYTVFEKRIPKFIRL